MTRPEDRAPAPAGALAAGARWVTSVVVLPIGLLLSVLLLDAAAHSRYWPLLIVGLLDEPAHLATALLCLLAFLPGRHRGLLPWALAGSVLIDADHVPLYAWNVLADADGGRPVTHCLATAALLATAGALAGLLPRQRLRAPLLGLALGVVLHLFRDLFTGPGVPLFWPVDPAVLLFPYRTYVLVLVALTAIAVVHQARTHRWED